MLHPYKLRSPRSVIKSKRPNRNWILNNIIYSNNIDDMLYFEFIELKN